MIIDFDNISAAQRYFAMVQTIIPRPIAWVLSDNGQGEGSTRFNLAPYSFFTGVCSDPPLLMLSAGKKAAGEESGALKDTARNIIEREHFVVHIASLPSLDNLNASAQTLNHGESEIDTLGLTLCDFAGSTLPRLVCCNVAMYCTLYRHDTIGNTPQQILYGEIHQLYVKDEICSESDNARLTIDSAKLNPLARLGGANYSGIGKNLTAKRPA